LKGIIFDMDGVIIDSEPIHLKLEKELLEEMGGNYLDVNRDNFIGTTDAHMWNTFKKQFDIKLSVEELINIKRKRFIENLDEIPLVNNVLELMKSLHNEGYNLGLASSNNRDAVESVKEKYNLTKYIDIFMNGEEVLKGKPNPEIFLTTAKYMNIKPENCLVIEDARNGVLAAKSAGMKCIGLQNKNSGTQDLSGADFVVDSYEDLTLESIKNLLNKY